MAEASEAVTTGAAEAKTVASGVDLLARVTGQLVVLFA